MTLAGKHTYNDKSPVLWAITFSIDYGQKNPFPFTFMKSTVGQAVHEAHTIIIYMLGFFSCFFACGALAASISVGIVIPSTWFVYLYNILLA